VEGEPVVVLVRPENFRIGGEAKPADGAISWSGQVKHVAFRGARVSMSVETPARELNVETSPLLQVREGEALTLSVPSHGAWAIRPSAPGA
jgi:ABC-type Fe3+/spermidine/putrescine transport system ATPase subunit